MTVLQPSIRQLGNVKEIHTAVPINVPLNFKKRAKRKGFNNKLYFLKIFRLLPADQPQIQPDIFMSRRRIVIARIRPVCPHVLLSQPGKRVRPHALKFDSLRVPQKPAGHRL